MTVYKSRLPTDSAARKRVPMASGLLDYFPDALAAVAEVSWLGNQKHNPGEEMHWARGKSMDHADCIVRHLTERGTRDVEGVRHSASLAWRALALLQQELEQELGLPLPRAAKDVTKLPPASARPADAIDGAGGCQLADESEKRTSGAIIESCTPFGGWLWWRFGVDAALAETGGEG